MDDIICATILIDLFVVKYDIVQYQFQLFWNHNHELSFTWCFCFHISDVHDINSKLVFIVFYGVGHCRLLNEDMGIETSKLYCEQLDLVELLLKLLLITYSSSASSSSAWWWNQGTNKEKCCLYFDDVRPNSIGHKLNRLSFEEIWCCMTRAQNTFQVANMVPSYVGSKYLIQRAIINVSY